ncbi:MAG: ABC transporter substrate-binding protein, partial [Alphaproteobacteria bacterium]|nr:ABC transporter substrate-binding protein [Alphaproteobacteria bacterium]MDA7987663.1 ABC transporter substrate-binding protein [Alphaproteobacteria bacterium]
MINARHHAVRSLHSLAVAAAVTVAVTAATGNTATAEPPPPHSFQNWQDTLNAARNAEVKFHAWGGDMKINEYIRWAGDELQEQFGIRLTHVKLDDTAAAVSKVLAEKTAGRNDNGAVDLIWINGENFRAMKQNRLLWGPFAAKLPSWKLLDAEKQPNLTEDFGTPTDGYESPWGNSQFNFVYDQRFVSPLPASAAGILAAARDNPGRLSYPAPPDFYGTAFLKQMLLVLVADTAPFYRPAPENDAEQQRLTAPLWEWLDKLHPHLWREGGAFPESGQAQLGLLNDGELFNGVSFSILETPAKRLDGRLPPSARHILLAEGSLANTHFLAIPYNAANPAASMAVAEFFLSPEAQIRKQDIRTWGDATVLSLERLEQDHRNAFAGLPGGDTLPAPVSSLREPHSSWVEAIENEWLRRY